MEEYRLVIVVVKDYLMFKIFIKYSISMISGGSKSKNNF